MPEEIPLVMGMAWFKRENYEELKRVSSDGTMPFESYDDWLQASENGFNKFTRDGYTVHKIDIDPYTFPAWCAARGMDVNSRARIRFVNEAVGRMHLKKD